MNNKIINILSMTLLIITSLSYGDKKKLCEPYASVRVLPKHLGHNWFDHTNRKMLKQFIQTLHPTTVVEIGSWFGESTVFMGELLPANSKLYAVDHWRGSIEHQTDPVFSKAAKVCYHHFLSNVINYNLTEKIVPMRMSSLEAAEMLNISTDLIYVDGSHDPEDVYNDIMAWYPKLNKDGIICGDDYAWGNAQLGFVKDGVQKAANELNINYSVEQDVFWYFPPKP